MQDKMILDNETINKIVNSADEETLEEIYAKIGDKQIENIKLKLKADIEHIADVLCCLLCRQL